MVDAQALDLPCPYQFEDQPMGVIENLFVLHPHADKACHLEEAPVAEVRGGIFPVEQLPILLCEELRHCERVHRKGQQTASIRSDPRLDLPGAFIRKRKKAIEILKVHTAIDGLMAEMKLLRRENFVEGLSKLRQSKLPAPVYVEASGIATSRSMPEDVVPSGIFDGGGHMIRHDIQDQPHSRTLQGRTEHVEALTTAECWIDLVRIGDIVAMRRSRRGREDG